MEANIYIGLMTGTSSDSLDCAAIKSSNDKIKILGLENFDIPDQLKKRIIQNSQAQEIVPTEIKKLDKDLGKFFSESIQKFLILHSIDENQVVAIGSHGQTIKHDPNAARPFSLQLGDPQIISNNLKITTVGNFREDDIEAGGQGAPISPVFHKEFFSISDEKRVIINIGGITNISLLNQGPVIGFDTGPGNCLMDSWNRKNGRGAYDIDGNWARSGAINQVLLNNMMNDKYFLLGYPKSTGPDYFNEVWLQGYLNSIDQNLLPKDIQATLTELTAHSLAKALEEINALEDNIYFCGGGVHNSYLIERISKRFKKNSLTTQALGIDPDYLEAICFAWLAKKRLENTKFNLQKITGSKKDVYLGKLYSPLR